MTLSRLSLLAAAALPRWRVGLTKLLAIAALVLLGGPGCADKNKPVSVSGTVTFEGQPLANANVALIPEEGGTGRMAFGQTDAGGKFRLTTWRPDDGAVPGTYKVTVKVVDPEVEAKTKELRNPKLDPARRAELMKMTATPNPNDPGVPSTYQNATTTPLKLEVPPSGKVEFHLNKQGT
jgi:hypothetical protein